MVINYVASNIISKFESPIFISSEVMGGQKMYVTILNYALKQKLIKIKS